MAGNSCMAASRPDFGREGNGNSSARGRHLTQHSTLEPISVPTKLPSSIYCHRSGEDRIGEERSGDGSDAC